MSTPELRRYFLWGPKKFLMEAAASVVSEKVNPFKNSPAAGKFFLNFAAYGAEPQVVLAFILRE